MATHVVKAPSVAPVPASTTQVQSARFIPLTASPTAAFWCELSHRKLHYLQLSSEGIPIVGWWRGGDSTLKLDWKSFLPRDYSNTHDMTEADKYHRLWSVPCQTITNTEAAAIVDSGWVACPGVVYVMNTIEEFKNMDMATLLVSSDWGGCRVWKDIVSNNIDNDPSLISRFMLLTYVDLKKHHYYYWFGFPALKVGVSDDVIEKSSCSSLSELGWSSMQRSSLLRQWQRLRLSEAELRLSSVGDSSTADATLAVLPATDVDSSNSSNRSKTAILSLGIPIFIIRQIKVNNDTDISIEKYCHSRVGDVFGSASDEAPSAWLAVVDPSSDAQYPGWVLRNVLAMIKVHYNSGVTCRDNNEVLNVLCLRDQEMVLVSRIRPSLLLHSLFDENNSQFITNLSPLNCSGWSVNQRGKPGASIISLAKVLDSLSIAKQSVDLNLSLMRWRQLPDMQLDHLKSLRCLLLGAGTLGCAVARGLLGWGIHHITFVDNGRVSFSNPVRQSLFTYEDCLNGGLPKAEAAASRLSAIISWAVTKGYNLNIAMPGHPIPTLDANKDAYEASHQDYLTLSSLIVEHDIIFLLTDTRESRWLPTLICATEKKILINVALGFDSYLVMRHGVGSEESTSKLGCYFCSDVVSPTNSLRDRTMDQQCTVTRPGAAPIAAALAVELTVALVHHSNYRRHCDVAADDLTCLGSVPHQIRGFLSSYRQMSLFGSSFNRCTACSPIVVTAFQGVEKDQTQDHRWSFICQVCSGMSGCEGGDFLEDLSGLSEMKRSAEAAMDDICLDDVTDDDKSNDEDDW